MENIFVSILCLFLCGFLEIITYENDKIDIVDLTEPTNWKYVSEYYTNVESGWKICINCGLPGMGTAMHLEHSGSVGSMYPAVIPSEYLLTRLAIIDVSTYAVHDEDFILTLELALKWPYLKHNPLEPTLLLFKFGWKEKPYKHRIRRIRSCLCRVPGISYELAEWISTKLTHVVGVATDAPTLESHQTMEYTTRTIANLLGKSGIYMIENVNIIKKIPEQGCMAISMPLKLLNTKYVPTRLMAFCPTTKTDMHVSVGLREPASKNFHQITNSRIYDVHMHELMN